MIAWHTWDSSFSIQEISHDSVLWGWIFHGEGSTMPEGEINPSISNNFEAHTQLWPLLRNQCHFGYSQMHRECLLFRVHDENVIRDILAVRDTCIFLGREQMRDLPQRACFSSSSTRSRCRLRFRIIPSTTHFGPTVCRTASFPGALHLRAGFEVGARVRSPRSTQSAPAGRLRKAAHRTHLDKICKNYKLCNF